MPGWSTRLPQRRLGRLEKLVHIALINVERGHDKCESRWVVDLVWGCCGENFRSRDEREGGRGFGGGGEGDSGHVIGNPVRRGRLQYVQYSKMVLPVCISGPLLYF